MKYFRTAHGLWQLHPTPLASVNTHSVVQNDTHVNLADEGKELRRAACRVLGAVRWISFTTCSCVCAFHGEICSESPGTHVRSRRAMQYQVQQVLCR